MSKLRAGILGATGLVGQQFARIISDHPDFELAGLYASSLSSGKKYSESLKHISVQHGNYAKEMEVSSIEDIKADIVELDILFSSLPANMADIEAELSEKVPVITKSSAHRMDRDIPLIIPEVNPDHLQLLDIQRKRKKGGFLSSDPNCSTTQLVLALKPLEEFGIEWVNVTTMQALSGAGYPGVSSMDMMGNIIPHIEMEEEKMERETGKILGKFYKDQIVFAENPRIIAKCNRVPVIDGHMETVFVKLTYSPDISEVRKSLSNFKGAKASRGLHSSPDQINIVLDEVDRPQPRLDLMAGNGMSVVIGGLKKAGDVLTFTSLSHNIIRGAAGGAVLHAELLHRSGYIL